MDSYLQSIVKKLNKFEVFEYSNIVDLLDTIPKDTSENVTNWKDQIEKAVFNCNESLYQEILKKV